MKGIPAPVEPSEPGSQGGRAPEDLLMPALIAKRSALENNVAAMAAYCRDRGVRLDPHAETHMAAAAGVDGLLTYF